MSVDSSYGDDDNTDIGIVEQADGSVIIDINPRRVKVSDKPSSHNENLAELVSDSELSWLASWLLEGIEEDDRSRTKWLRDRADGLKLLGFSIEPPRGDAAGGSAPVEGMATVRHPLLAEAVLHFQANARGEMLPADGPCKTEVWGKKTAVMDDLAEELQDAMNYFLTETATEFVPDTDRLLLMTGYSGMSFKKVYKCPIKRRPVSETVDAEHLIVSNTAVDIQSAPRATHVIPMQQTTFKRMVLAGVYRDVDLTPPDAHINPFDAARARMDGVNLNVTRPEDQVYTIYECYCDINLAGFEHKDANGKVTGLPLPYRVTIEKTSRVILDIRRDWKEDDQDCIRKKTFVPFGFVPAFGFYNIGLLQILGNSTLAVTGAWRMLLDAGMFSSFPGWLYAKNGARQVDNNFRVPPGGGMPIEVPAGMKLGDAIMPIPYKAPDPTFIQLIELISSNGQRLGGTADLPTSDGRSDVPVGTMLAAIEQAMKVLDAVHKRLHAAQSRELALIRDLIREDPEALWRGTPNHAGWDAEKVLMALNAYNVVPRSDPNTPSHVHRLMKATALGQVAQAAPPGLFDAKAVVLRLLRMMRIDDVDTLLAAPEAQGQQLDPMAEQANVAREANAAKVQATQQQTQVKLLDIQSRAQTAHDKMQSDLELEKLRIAEHLAVHPNAENELAGMR